MISASGLAAFVTLSFAAAYVQTLTGFAFGLLVMAGIALSGLIPLPEAAIVVSLLTLVNALVVLRRGWRSIALKPFCLSLAGTLPMVLAGYWLLELLAATSLSPLRLCLGLIIIVSSLQLVTRPRSLQAVSSGPSFMAFGAMAGLMGGLFSTSGPPLVFQFYRQPLPYVVIRETLVAIFAINSLFRLGVVTATGAWHAHAWLWALSGLPGVIAATHLARRWPPPLTPAALRLVAFCLLLISGLSLIVPVIVSGLR